MAKLVTGLFNTRSSAMLAIEDLMRHGVSQEDISLLLTDTTLGREFFMDVNSKAPEGACMGTIIGGIVGSILAYCVAVGYIADPGLGLYGSNLLVSTLAGCGIGMLFGLLVGALCGAAIPEYEAKLDRIGRKGGILVGTYIHPKRQYEVRRLLQAAGGHGVRSRNVRDTAIRRDAAKEVYTPVTNTDTTLR